MLEGLILFQENPSYFSKLVYQIQLKQLLFFFNAALFKERNHKFDI